MELLQSPLASNTLSSSVNLLCAFVGVLSSGKLYLGLLHCKYIEDLLHPFTPDVERSQVPCVPLTLQSAPSILSPAAYPQGNTNPFP